MDFKSSFCLQISQTFTYSLAGMHSLFSILLCDTQTVTNVISQNALPRDNLQILCHLIVVKIWVQNHFKGYKKEIKTLKFPILDVRC